jgi:Arc/MetJ family transcription regulator
MGALMSKLEVELDDETLAEAASYLGTTSAADTVKAALLHAVEGKQRLEAFDRLGEMADAGDFDLLADKKNYRR